MMQLVHDVPGRLRFRVASLKGDHRRAATLRHQVRALGGVTMASFNTVTGSLVIHYKTAQGAKESIIDGLNALAQGAIEVTPLQRPCPDLADIVSDMIVERLVERAIQMAVAALI